MLVVECFDWEIACTGIAASAPGASMHANRVIATTVAARREGVRVALRRREAQSVCPELIVRDVDWALAARQFEPIVATLESIAPGVAIERPGSCSVPTRGPSKYFGGDEALAQHIAMLVEETLRDTKIDTACAIGIADGTFAACLAAQSHLIIPPGETREFLATKPITALGDPDFCDLLRRLGVRSLGDLASLPRRDLVGRFGFVGERAHHLACGTEGELFHGRDVPADLTVTSELDPPVERVDAAAFATKRLADELHGRLTARGLACSQVVIEAETETGETLRRTWRHGGTLSASAVADRMRWQLEGWQSGPISMLRLIPEHVLPANGTQLRLWGGTTATDEKAVAALARVQALLGEREVVTAVVVGGRNPSTQVCFVPWGDSREEVVTHLDKPWPGKLPTPSPATVYAKAKPAEVFDANDAVVSVDGRGRVSSPPASVVIDGIRQTIASWAGPWPVDERWWDASQHVRKARFQLATDDGHAYLVSLEKQHWWLEASYD